MTGYWERLEAASRSSGSVLCIGLDPEPDRIPGGVAGALDHCLRVVCQTAGVACCYKPNLAFWEQYGPEGMQALLELRRQIPSEIPVLLDAKRGDVGHTMRAYGRALFERLAADAVTVSPYLGADSLRELTVYADRGVYVLCRSSNPGAADLQHLDAGGQPLYLRVAELAEQVNEFRNVGLVVGATAPDEIAELRRTSRLPFLIPGIGAQGGDLEQAVRAARGGERGSCLVAVSRSVLYADQPGQAAAEIARRIGGVLAAA